MLTVALVVSALAFAPPEPTRTPLHRTVDLDVGETQTTSLPNGTRVTVKLLDLKEDRDRFRDAVREARVTVEINGRKETLVSGNYRLPVAVGGVQADCPVTHGVYTNSSDDAWGLEKAARVRVWPAGSPWVEPGTFRYPARQRWFASGTQMANEPVFVDGGEVPATKKVYYHYGLDIGGAEGRIDVEAATNGLVVSSGAARLPGYEDTPVSPRYDVVYLLDDRGWFYRYSHMKSIESAIKPGARVRMGQKIGVLGKEGGSGGWSHLHFEARAKQPSGKWGIEEAYAFLWQSYLHEFQPDVIAVARPHHLAAVGETVRLDGSRSWARNGPVRPRWVLSNGSTEQAFTAERSYDQPGTYSETFQAADPNGHVAYDFTVVQVLDPKAPSTLPPSVQAAYAPTMGITVDSPVTFLVRTFRTTDGEETWNFGDGTSPVKVRSDGNREIHNPNGFAVTEHRFAQPGNYIVSVSRTNQHGHTGTARLWVHVEARPPGDGK